MAGTVGRSKDVSSGVEGEPSCSFISSTTPWQRLLPVAVLAATRTRKDLAKDRMGNLDHACCQDGHQPHHHLLNADADTTPRAVRDPGPGWAIVWHRRSAGRRSTACCV